MSESIHFRSNAEVFMRALWRGRIEYRGWVYQIIPKGEDIVAASGVYVADHDVMVRELTMEKNGVKSKIYLPCDLSLNDIFKMTEDMTEEERISIIMDTAIRELPAKHRARPAVSKVTY